MSPALDAAAPALAEGAIERRLAGWTAALRFEDLPAPVLRIAKDFVLDTLGVIGGAARAPGMAELRSALAAWEPSGGIATMLLGGPRVAPATAALANGAAAHALDFDDQHDPARIHAFCVILPAALAVAEAEGAVDGRRFLAAIVAGVEIFCRLGLTCHGSLGRGWHPTTALGTLAAAATAAKLMRLDEARTLHAMGLAFTQMGGTTQFIADGALAKRLGPGFAARSGVLAAHLARAGLTGPWRYLSGKAGLFNLHEQGDVLAPILHEGLGEAWRMAKLSMKPYPCCRCVHTVIELALELRREGLVPERIARGEIFLGRVNRQIVGANFDPAAPNPVVHAQFNACYAFAAALRDGAVTIPSFAPERIRAEDVRFATKLRTLEAEELPPAEIAPARLRLELTDGTVLERARPTMKGSPEEPMSRAEVLAKFRACLAAGLGTEPEAADCLAARIEALEYLPDVAALITGFRALDRA
jgi:2-methylcitrate dehydratase PrpD